MSSSNKEHTLQASLAKDITKVSSLREKMDTHGKAFERIEDEQFDEHHTVLDELQSIRDQAQELAPTLCLSNRKLSPSDEHKCELLIQRYQHFLGTSQGQSYRQSLIEFDKAELIYLRKSFHVEHKRNILEQEKPTYNFRQLFTEGLCESFWDQLGRACKSFLDGPQNDIEEDQEIYSKLMEKDKLASNTPRTRYIAIFNAFELLNRYLSVNKREPSGTLYNQVLSLSHAGCHLIDYYILIEGIVKAAPEPELDGKRYPIIDHPDDFLRLDVGKAQLRHRPEWAHAIQQVATNYGKLLKFDASSNVVPMVELPRLTNRKERLYRSGSSSPARSAAELH